MNPHALNPGTVRRRAAIAGAVLVALFVLVMLSPLRHLTGADGAALRAWMADSGRWHGPLFTAVCAVAVACGTPRLAWATLGGATFGWWEGAIVTTLGVSVGCQLTFLWVRALARPWASRRQSDRVVALDSLVTRHGLLTAFMVRVLPVGSCHAANIALSMTGMSSRSYLMGTLVGTLPGTVTFALIGASMLDRSAHGVVAGVSLLIITTVAWGVVARRSTVARSLIASVRAKRVPRVTVEKRSGASIDPARARCNERVAPGRRCPAVVGVATERTTTSHDDRARSPESARQGTSNASFDETQLARARRR